jgi:hypothetical protein
MNKCCVCRYAYIHIVFTKSITYYYYVHMYLMHEYIGVENSLPGYYVNLQTFTKI